MRFMYYQATLYKFTQSMMMAGVSVWILAEETRVEYFLKQASRWTKLLQTKLTEWLTLNKHHHNLIKEEVDELAPFSTLYRMHKI